MNRRLLTLAVILGFGAYAFAGVWDTATPANTDPISQGDDRIREMKTAIQESLRGGATEGDEAVFPGGSAATAPIFRYRGLKGTILARPAATYGGLYYDIEHRVLQRSNGSVWDNLYNNPEKMAVHQASAAAVTSSVGVVTLTEQANSFNIAGTEAVTSFSGWSSGTFIAKWDSARIITHSASISLANSLSRNVVAGDISVYEFTAANVVREISHHGAGAGAHIGEIRIHASSTVPAGFLECNGASLLRSDYPGLWAVLGGANGIADATHFNIPDLRGKFARGWDHGAGQDPDAASRTAVTGGNSGDAVGSLQADAFESHTHSYTRADNNNVMGAGANTVLNATSSQSTGATGGNETRPTNVNVMYIIKY